MWSNEPSWHFTTTWEASVLSLAPLLNTIASFLFIKKRGAKKRSKMCQMCVGCFWQMYYFPCIMLNTVQHISELLRYGGIVCIRKYFLSLLQRLYYIKVVVFKGMNSNAYLAWRSYTYNHNPLFSPEQKTSSTHPQSAAAEQGQSQTHTKAPGPGARSVPSPTAHQSHFSPRTIPDSKPDIHDMSLQSLNQ